MPDYKDLSCDGGYEVAATDEAPRGLRCTAPRRSCRRFDSRTTGLRRLLLLVALTASTALAGAAAGSGTAGPLVQSTGRPAADDICTMASVEQRATIEVRVAHAEDFCELLSQALAIVFRTRPFVTPGVLWHYAESAPSCQLRFGSTRHRMVVHNSMRTCRWFARHASGWRAEASVRWPASRPPESMDARLGPDKHPGPIFITVTRGELIYYLYDDPTCTPHEVKAGEGFVDDGQGHMIRNESGEAAQDVSVAIAPTGGAFRSELDAPNPNCGF
ncbi:MAG TPA: hypothetical protein VJL85_01805 [Gaiellaceae bacterium]|nr:hypothetical protein [Gaiellaceae bacterium]